METIRLGSQIVIPASMRENVPEGEKLLIIRDGERYII